MRQGAVRWLSPVGFFTMRWWEWGPVDGAPVVCVHGLTRSGRDFDDLARALGAAGRRVICPDLPGRGASDWLEVIAGRLLAEASSSALAVGRRVRAVDASVIPAPGSGKNWRLHAVYELREQRFSHLDV